MDYICTKVTNKQNVYKQRHVIHLNQTVTKKFHYKYILMALVCGISKGLACSYYVLIVTFTTNRSYVTGLASCSKERFTPYVNICHLVT